MGCKCNPTVLGFHCTPYKEKLGILVGAPHFKNKTPPRGVIIHRGDPLTRREEPLYIEWDAVADFLQLQMELDDTVSHGATVQTDNEACRAIKYGLCRNGLDNHRLGPYQGNSRPLLRLDLKLSVQ